ncbi:MAG: NAD(P)-dependent oxidoreductase [Acidimicrobiales bacterium]|nr:NAD(P)-dependent oxidoreductase [Acidimicrobiales bacterium]
MTTADQRIIVTGAGGYLGGRVSAELDGRVAAIVRRSVPWLPSDAQTVGDLLEPDDDLLDAFADASAVIHLAGHNEVLARTEPDRARDETVAATQTVIDAAQANGIRRVVYVSTIHVYGEHLVPGATIDERTEAAPVSAYAEARAACESLLLDASALDPVVLRLSNAVGAPADPSVDRWTLVASELSRDAVLDQTMVLRSPGLQTRDFITVSDASRIAVESCAGTVPGGVYNLASGHSISIRDLAHVIGDRVEERYGHRPTLEAPPADDEPEEPYTFDVSALAAHGIRAEQPIRVGIDELIDHCRKHRTQLHATRGTT